MGDVGRHSVRIRIFVYANVLMIRILNIAVVRFIGASVIVSSNYCPIADVARK